MQDKHGKLYADIDIKCSNDRTTVWLTAHPWIVNMTLQGKLQCSLEQCRFLTCNSEDATHTHSRTQSKVYGYSSSQCNTATPQQELTCHMASQYYLLPGICDIHTFIPAKAGTRFSDSKGCKAELTYDKVELT